MKSLITLGLLCLIAIFKVGATNYYVSANTGNDNNKGKSIQFPFKSIGKVNAMFGQFLPGDSILFKRGEVFYGGISITASGIAGKPLVISAYGVGERPVITGFMRATGFIPIGDQLWESKPIITQQSPNLVVIDNKIVQIGRFPNHGYLPAIKPMGKTNLSNPLIPPGINWTGAEIVTRPLAYQLTRSKIAAHRGTEIDYKGSLAMPANWGFFIQNSLAACDTLHEWYFNPVSRKLALYAPQVPGEVNVTTIDTLVNTGSQDYITIEHLSLRGANLFGVAGGAYGHGKQIIIRHCAIQFAGKDGVNLTVTSDNMVDSCTVADVNNNGIIFSNVGGASSSATITNNHVTRAGTRAGMGYEGNLGYSGIAVFGPDALIQNNLVDTIGYCGIYFDFNNNTVVRNNYINYYCITQNDGGGVYTWMGNQRNNATGRKIVSNIIENGIGNTEGTHFSTIAVAGIYADDFSSGIDIDSNTIYNPGYSGIYLHNTNSLQVRQNIVVDAIQAQLLVVNNGHPNQRMHNNTITSNIFVSLSSKFNVNIITKGSDVDEFFESPAKFDCNYFYKNQSESTFRVDTAGTEGKTVGHSYSVASFGAAYPPYNAHSKQIAKGKVLYYRNPSQRTAAFTFPGHRTRTVDGVVIDNELLLAPYRGKILLAAGK